MHRHHGGNRQYKKKRIRNGPHWIWKSLLKTLRIPEPGSHGQFAQRKLRTNAWRPPQSITCRGKISQPQGHNLQQLSLLLSKNRKGENRSQLPNPSFIIVAQTLKSQNTSRHSSQPLRSSQSTRSTWRRPPTFDAQHHFAPRLIFATSLT